MSTLSYAIAYARQGWRVFPVGRDKQPLTPHGFKDATTDERVIESWFDGVDGLAGANIGHDIPEGTVVLDFDPRNGAPPVYSLDLPRTLTVKTAGGGQHLYFTVPDGLEFKGSYMQGVDVKAPGKGYVLLPPSQTDKGEYLWQESGRIVSLPKRILDLIVRQPREMTPENFSGSKAFFPWETASRYGRGALAKATARILEADNGQRNRILYGETKDITRLVNGGEVDVTRLADLRDAALEAGLEYHETQATMESAYNSVGTEYRKAPSR